MLILANEMIYGKIARAVCDAEYNEHLETRYPSKNSNEALSSNLANLILKKGNH